MQPIRIKDPALASQIDEGQLAWYHYLAPLSEHYAIQIQTRDYHGKKFAYWGHITLQNAANMMLPLKQAGVELVVGACNLDSTNDAMAAYLAAHGIPVFGWSGMSQADYQENLAIVRSFEADYLCDMGGELCQAYLDKQPPVIGALEATTSGLHVLGKHSLPFPVFNWNNIPLKDLHNRYHVGDTIWPAFNQVTGMSLYGRRVLVIGCGPVGQGIAERAHALGALVAVTDLDAVRLLEARHFGCETVSLEQGLERCQIIVTATGIEGVLDAAQLPRVRPGAILFNAGHSNREIDIDWLALQPHRRMKAHIERYDLEQTHLYLLAQGSLLNLAGGAGPYGVDMFDHYVAVMLLGITWMLDGIPDDIQPGLQAYPSHLEQEIARLSIKLSP